ncbi:hypothetical protein [Streptomyces sp. NPDC002889]|uniref:hypothetical protein n=1 Tax=Streptomyces sp. NPDC002889 TaxID=3364669 RepID=UPI0036A6CBB3
MSVLDEPLKKFLCPATAKVMAETLGLAVLVRGATPGPPAECRIGDCREASC